MSGNNAQTRVAIMAATEQDHSHLSSLLAGAGLNVVLQEVAGEDFIRQLEQTPADVLLVNLGDDENTEVDIIDTLLEYDSLPVLFNDNSKAGAETNALWAKKLARKLEQMARDDQSGSGDDPVMELQTEPESGLLESETGFELATGLDIQDVAEPANTEPSTDFEWLMEEEFSPEEGSAFNQQPAMDSERDVVANSADQWLTETTVERAAQKAAELASQNTENPDTTLSLDTASETEATLEFGRDYVPEVDAAVSEMLADADPGPENAAYLEDETGEEIDSLPRQGESTLVAVKEENTSPDVSDEAAVNVWVLGASLGGPQAVRQFLMAIRKDLPVAFILAQHIGENHISLLADQLDRVTRFKVLPGYNGHMIRHFEVILAPAGKNVHITNDGYLSLSDQEEDAIYSPCINDVMTAVANRYGNMAGTIVFSGMGDDGAIGCQSMADNGGIVWAQDVDSCVISSMPDQARKTNNVTFSANPRRLADELYKYYME